jgi:hypothetical protein
VLYCILKKEKKGPHIIEMEQKDFTKQNKNLKKKQSKSKKLGMKNKQPNKLRRKKRSKLTIQSKHKSTEKNSIVAELKNSRLLNSESVRNWKQKRITTSSYPISRSSIFLHHRRYSGFDTE